MPRPTDRRVSTKGLSKDPRLAGKTQAFRLLWRVLVQGCLRTGKVLEVSPDEYEKIIFEPCVYCGSPPGAGRNGADRFDNAKGYTRENLVACCALCNGMKSKRSAETFVEHARRIARHIDALEAEGREVGGR